MYLDDDQSIGLNTHDIIHVSVGQDLLEIFLTMTYNSNWPEIKASLFSEHKLLEKLVNAAAVFHIKHPFHLAFTPDEQVHGEVIFSPRISAFRRRDLPPAQCITFLSPASIVSLVQPADMNRTMSAELSLAKDQELQSVILKLIVPRTCERLYQTDI